MKDLNDIDSIPVAIVLLIFSRHYPDSSPVIFAQCLFSTLHNENWCSDIRKWIFACRITKLPVRPWKSIVLEQKDTYETTWKQRRYNIHDKNSVGNKPMISIKQILVLTDSGSYYTARRQMRHFGHSCRRSASVHTPMFTGHVDLLLVLPSTCTDREVVCTDPHGSIPPMSDLLLVRLWGTQTLEAPCLLESYSDGLTKVRTKI